VLAAIVSAWLARTEWRGTRQAEYSAFRRR